MTFRHILAGAAALTAGQVLSYGLSFARNMILAWMLTKADFGLAAAFATTVTLLEFVSRLSFGQQLIQAKHACLDDLQATSHACLILVGCACGIVFLALSAPLSALFNVGDYTWAFACLGLIPVFRGFEHLDTVRQRRDLNFRPSLVCELVPQLVTTLATWSVTRMLPDYRAILVLTIAKALLTVALTHLLAERRYVVQMDRALIPSIVAFNAPLLGNAAVMFAAQQADQLVIPRFVSLEALASYSAAFSLVSIPWFVVAQLSSSLMLPVLAREQEDQRRFAARYRDCLQLAAACSVIVITPLVATGEQIIRLLYPERYAGAGVVVAVLATSCALRFVRIAPAVASLARADGLNQLYSNMWRSISLPIAVLTGALGGGLLTIAAAGIAGEIIATAATLQHLQRHDRISLRDHARPLMVVLAGLIAAVVLRPFLRDLTPIAGLIALPVLWLAAVASIRLILPDAFRRAMAALRERPHLLRRAVVPA